MTGIARACEMGLLEERRYVVSTLVNVMLPSRSGHGLNSITGRFGRNMLRSPVSSLFSD